MKLKTITIEGYKSIEKIVFDLDYSIKEQTYALIGINEAGKSSFLEAINSFNGEKENIDKNFFYKDNVNSAKSIEIIFEYEQCESLTNGIKEKLKGIGVNDSVVDRIEVEKVSLKKVFEAGNSGRSEIKKIIFKDNLSGCVYSKNNKKFTIQTENPPKEKGEVSKTDAISLKNYLIENVDLLNICLSNMHNILFWKSSDKYLIDKPVNLLTFQASPRKHSIPLANCFNLIGIKDEDIPKKINIILSDSVERKNFISKLEEDITSHVKSIWKEHQVKIKFDINENALTFLVEDDKVEHNSEKINQRSDGFRQFISFLLSISAENKTKELKNYILLIDEPEQHLHPKAAEFLKENLIKITSKATDKNIVFFATHSLFMIDQENLKRNYIVTKKDNKKSKIKQVNNTINTYSAIIYEVFNVYTNDYHNELIGWIQTKKDIMNFKDLNNYFKNNKMGTRDKYREIKKDNSGKVHRGIALSLYIRHQIHHPENNENDKFSKNDLIKSINELVELKKKIIDGTDINNEKQKKSIEP